MREHYGGRQYYEAGLCVSAHIYGDFWQRKGSPCPCIRVQSVPMPIYRGFLAVQSTHLPMYSFFPHAHIPVACLQCKVSLCQNMVFFVAVQCVSMPICRQSFGIAMCSPAAWGHNGSQRISCIGACGHFAPPKSPMHIGVATFCFAKNPHIYGYGDTLQGPKAFSIWAWVSIKKLFILVVQNCAGQ